MITPELAYIAGFIIGDGNLSEKYLIRAVEENKRFMKNVFLKVFHKAFNKLPKIYFDRFNNSYVAYLHSKEIWNVFVNELNIPTGKKSKIVRIPTPIMNSDVLSKASFLSAIFDAEGSVVEVKDPIHHPNGYPRIQLKVYNHKLAKDIFDLLIQFESKPKLYLYSDFAVIHINGRKNCKSFLEKIGFKHPLKNEKLNIFLAKDTGQGVCFCGKDNLLIKVSVAKAKVRNASVARGLKGPEVTRTRPETA